MDMIRPIISSDFTAIKVFWEAYGKDIAPELLYPAHTSYCLERNGSIVYAIALHKIVGLPGGYVEGLVRNPKQEAELEDLKSLVLHMEKQARMLGCKVLMASAENEYLASRYNDLGYNRNVGQYHVVTKEID